MGATVDYVVRMASAGLPVDRVASEAEVTSIVNTIAGAFGLSPEDHAKALRTLLSIRLVKMDTGFALLDKHTPWLAARRASIDPYYWTRLRLQLHASWPASVVTALDRSTDEILDVMGNPAESGTWKRRGLVMGDVQSGKTATYSALICKAADAGYRFIVLLTGTLETLRRQTQKRLDGSFVGFDSSEQLKKNGRSLLIGVGLLDGQRQATVFTSTAKDFSVSTLQALGLSLSALREPALVVVKKHTTILDNLIRWIKSYNAGADDGSVDIPLLLIDDEADNASINTNDEDRDPTAVNQRVRALLALFRQTTYVGFTATPFANIFVDPDTDESMLGDDLFPRDFIYALQAPSNYIGPRRLFIEETPPPGYLREISDLAPVLPAKHRSTFQLNGLPSTLVDALGTFIVANAIRDLRGDLHTHRSMLVNISQFTAIQDRAEALLHTELTRMKDDIRLFAMLDHDKAIKSPVLRHLHDVWTREYASCGFEWKTILRALHEATQPITTKPVNQRTGPSALDYDAYSETGLRVVAVGGNSLSRGLTLEGLMTSYFCRRTQMYDTLLQMGRWFGYRPMYEDLCRVWMSPEAVDWYGHITEATEELRDELANMKRLGRTPKDFGLAVRAHPDALLITARNKMRRATEITRVISLDHQSFESVELPSDADAIKTNLGLVNAFVRGLTMRTGWTDDGSRMKLIRGAMRSEVADLLQAFVVPPTEFRFQPASIAELLRATSDPSLDEWDVAIPSGDGKEFELGPIRLDAQLRSLRHIESSRTLVVSGNRRRVGSRGVEAAGLSMEEVSAAESAARAAAAAYAKANELPLPTRINVSDAFYREQRRRPLLVLHFLEGQPEKGSPVLPEHCSGAPMAAIGLSFPRLNSSSPAREVKYRINIVKARELFQSDLETDDDDPVIVEP